MLTKTDLNAIESLFDRKFEEKFEEKFAPVMKVVNKINKKLDLFIKTHSLEQKVFA